MSNRMGIPNITSTSVNVSTTAVTFHFDRSEDIPYAGEVLVRIVQTLPVGVDVTLPIYFGNVPLKWYNDEQVTVANLPGTGIYQVYYNSITKLLQLMTGYVEPVATTTELDTQFN